MEDKLKAKKAPERKQRTFQNMFSNVFSKAKRLRDDLHHLNEQYVDSEQYVANTSSSDDEEEIDELLKRAEAGVIGILSDFDKAGHLYLRKAKLLHSSQLSRSLQGCRQSK